MFKDLIQNLSKRQKIFILCFFQLIVIIIFAAIVSNIFNEKEHIEIANESKELGSIPNDELRGVKNELWYLLKNTVTDVDESVLDDVVVRDGTYEETINEDDDVTTATFLVDIDSLRQTYSITVSWSETEELPDSLDISCPPITEMKYKETFCQGMYNNTNSFDLYFPYYAFKEGTYDDDIEEYCDEEECYDDSEYDSGLMYSIEGDEDEKTIYIESSICDVDKYNQEALNYIKDNTPFYNNPEYKIEYSVNEVDVICD